MVDCEAICTNLKLNHLSWAWKNDYIIEQLFFFHYFTYQKAALFWDLVTYQASNNTLEI